MEGRIGPHYRLIGNTACFTQCTCNPVAILDVFRVYLQSLGAQRASTSNVLPNMLCHNAGPAGHPLDHGIHEVIKPCG